MNRYIALVYAKETIEKDWDNRSSIHIYNRDVWKKQTSCKYAMDIEGASMPYFDCIDVINALKDRVSDTLNIDLTYEILEIR